VTQGYWQAHQIRIIYNHFPFFAEHGPEPALEYSGDNRQNFDIAIERRSFLSYAKEKHNAVHTSRKRTGCSRKNDRKSGGQGRVCAQRRNSSQ
jgi:hypothetical protein